MPLTEALLDCISGSERCSTVHVQQEAAHRQEMAVTVKRNH